MSRSITSRVCDRVDLRAAGWNNSLAMDEPQTDARTSALLTLAPDPMQRMLLSRVLHGFDALEQTDFGELEPVGVTAPTESR